jgi:putative two-component system response regulator
MNTGAISKAPPEIATDDGGGDQGPRADTLLAMAQSQLVAYARDLKVVCESERKKSDAIARIHIDTLKRLLRALSWKDRETAAHNQRLGRYARALALRLGVGEPEADLIAAAAPMHDIGKIGIPDAILQKQGPLDEREWTIMKTHPTRGASLLDPEVSPVLRVARDIALCHHERWDGSGYPRGLRGAEIPLSGRIVALVDQYDALRSERSYKLAYDHRRACDVILRGDGRTRPGHFDPSVLNAFAAAQVELEAIFDKLPDEPVDATILAESLDAGPAGVEA